MNSQFIVVVPSKHPKLFLAAGHELGRPFAWCSEYPDAVKLTRLSAAKAIAAKHPGAQVYTVDGYESGTGPVHVVAS